MNRAAPCGLAALHAALAEARTGDVRSARQEIDRTPRDCTLCLRVRGDIDAAQKNWAGTAFWFEDSVRRAPSIPFAYADWGAMLLHNGDYDDAIAKFGVAHEKGPHFADPLEMWGEALMYVGRRDEAKEQFSLASHLDLNAADAAALARLVAAHA